MPAKRDNELLDTLRQRFETNMARHPDAGWHDVAERLGTQPDKLRTLRQMEDSGGEPDLIAIDAATGQMIFCDCAAETPSGRRSLCYDDAALQARKENKPAGSAQGMASAMGVELLTEDMYRALQALGPVDLKTSSWLQTPADIRSRGGAIFGDYRYGRVFVYHNGVQSYYAARGFRAMLKV